MSGVLQQFCTMQTGEIILLQYPGKIEAEILPDVIKKNTVIRRQREIIR